QPKELLTYTRRSAQRSGSGKKPAPVKSSKKGKPSTVAFCTGTGLPDCAARRNTTFSCNGAIYSCAHNQPLKLRSRATVKKLFKKRICYNYPAMPGSKKYTRKYNASLPRACHT